MSEITPGQASWIARNRALAGPQDDTDLVLTWPYLDPEQRQAEETGARAVIAAAMAETRTITAHLDQATRLMLDLGSNELAASARRIRKAAGLES